MKKVLIAAALLFSCACDWPFPTEPFGNLTAASVSVVDEAGSPIAGVRVSFQDFTADGRTFTVSATTPANGELIFAFAEPGERRCDVQLPAGYGAGPAGLTQQVLIERETTVRVRFTLVRAPSAP